MGYTDYQKMMGKEIIDPPGVTRTELSWSGGKGKDGYATVIYKDGIPVVCQWYSWDLDEAFFFEEIAKVIGPEYENDGVSGGNGHYSCVFKKKGA